MSDDVVLSTPVGTGDTIAADDIGGVKHQQVKVEFGADNTATPVSAANPMPTVQTGALPAGANAIGKLAANSGVDIGDVDVTSMPGTAADGAASLPAVQLVIAGWDGTNVQAIATDSSGIVQTDVVGDSATQAGAAARTADFDTGAGTVTTVMNGIALPANGGPVVGGTGTNPVRTDPTGSTTQPVSGTVTANLAAGTNNIGDVDVLTLPALPAGNNNIGDVDIASALPAGNNNIGDVDIASALPAGTNNIGDVDVLTLPALPAGNNNIGDVDVVTLPGIVGTVAHDAADSGAPVKTGARAISADITAVTANDRVDAFATLLGKGLMMPYCLPGATLQGSGNKTDTSDLALIAAQGAGVRIYVTHITITNAHATVGTKVVLKSAATIIWRGYADALGGGVCTALPVPLRLTANEALNGAAITNGADVDFTVVGYAAAE